MFANTQMGGMDLGFPDVCMTPPVAKPIPYPNFAFGPMGVPAAYNVLFRHPRPQPGDHHPADSGGRPGDRLGVASGTVMGPPVASPRRSPCSSTASPATRLTSFGSRTRPTARAYASRRASSRSCSSPLDVWRVDSALTVPPRACNG